jgi:ferredoxin
VEAIPPLTLEEKRIQIIGMAQIDQDRCIPWTEEGACIVCEEMCPLPEKAITFESLETLDPFGTPILLQRPKVLEEQCIGCGICEYKCPVEGEAAIQIVNSEGNHKLSMRQTTDNL